MPHPEHKAALLLTHSLRGVLDQWHLMCTSNLYYNHCTKQPISSYCFVAVKHAAAMPNGSFSHTGSCFSSHQVNFVIAFAGVYMCCMHTPTFHTPHMRTKLRPTNFALLASQDLKALRQCKSAPSHQRLWDHTQCQNLSWPLQSTISKRFYPG